MQKQVTTGTDSWLAGWLFGQVDGVTDGQMAGRVSWWMGKYSSVNRWMEGWLVSWMHDGIGRWTHGYEKPRRRMGANSDKGMDEGLTGRSIYQSIKRLSVWLIDHWIDWYVWLLDCVDWVIVKWQQLTWIDNWSHQDVFSQEELIVQAISGVAIVSPTMIIVSVWIIVKLSC